jgi:hypothetical protein
MSQKIDETHPWVLKQPSNSDCLETNFRLLWLVAMPAKSK